MTRTLTTHRWGYVDGVRTCRLCGVARPIWSRDHTGCTPREIHPAPRTPGLPCEWCDHRTGSRDADGAPRCAEGDGCTVTHIVTRPTPPDARVPPTLGRDGYDSPDDADPWGARHDRDLHHPRGVS